MPRSKTCIAITLEVNTFGVLAYETKQAHISIEEMAKALIKEALEWHEEKTLWVLAADRDVRQAARVAQGDVWK